MRSGHLYGMRLSDVHTQIPDPAFDSPRRGGESPDIGVPSLLEPAYLTFLSPYGGAAFVNVIADTLTFTGSNSIPSL